MSKENKAVRIVKYPKNGDIKCKCGGDVYVDGQGYHETPVGIGGIKNGVVIDKIRFSGWIGECEKCRRKVIAYKKKEPISVNINI